MRLRGFAQGCAGSVEFIGDDAVVGDVAAQLFQQTAQRETVRVVDRAGLQRLARHGQFVAGEEHGDFYAAAHLKLGAAD